MKKPQINVANQIEFLLNENIYLWLRRSDSEHVFEAKRKRSTLCLDSNFHFFFFYTEILNWVLCFLINGKNSL